MIIQCTNCDKKFEVDSSLIPETGRNIQCGSCSHTWFYKITDLSPDPVNLEFKSAKTSNDFKSINKGLDEKKIEEISINTQNLSKKNSSIKTKKSKNTINLGNILAYMIVAIISFIALVIVLDTFKSPLSDLFPSLELLLYNLFETIKDMFLFFKNLFV